MITIKLTEEELKLLLSFLQYDKRQLYPLDRELSLIVEKLEKALQEKQ